MAKSLIKTVPLPDDVWSRGSNSNGQLLSFGKNGDRHQCCIGVACTYLGVPDEALLKAHYAHNVNGPLPPAIQRLSDIGKENLNTNEHIELPVYRTNDDGELDDDTRVDRINAYLAEKHVPLQFRLKKATKAKRV